MIEKILIRFLVTLNAIIFLGLSAWLLSVFTLVAGFADFGSRHPVQYALIYVVSISLIIATLFIFWNLMRLKNWARVIWIILMLLLSLCSLVFFIDEQFFIPLDSLLLLNIYLLGVQKSIISFFSSRNSSSFSKTSFVWWFQTFNATSLLITSSGFS